MRVYVELAKRGYRRYTAYSAAAVAGLFTSVVFGILRSAVMGGVFASTGQIGGYGLAEAVTYVWLVQGLMAAVQMFGSNEIAMRVRTGDVAIDLMRPIDVQLAYLATDFGRAAYHLVFRGIPPVLIGALLYGLVPPADFAMWLAFATSVVLAVAVSFLVRFLYNLSAFWLMDFRGVSLVAVILANLLSGFVIPVAFFPSWLAALAKCTPFPAMVQTPIDIFTGNISGLAALGALSVQVLWVGGLFLVGRALFGVGRRTLVFQGG